MIDGRIYTFLKLCELMNYRKTAESLHMSQPAVTQHIQFLEKSYDCRLFSYNGRVLTKTKEGEELERYARSMLYNEKRFKSELKKPKAESVSLGATKSIGDYVIKDKVTELLKRDDIALNLIIDNTENLLSKLDSLELDLILAEGFVDKNIYGYKTVKNEELVGICSKDHVFAGKEVPLSEIFNEHIILREEGSGTRAVLEEFLRQKGYSADSFKRKSIISSFKLIKGAVSENCGISFVYESVAKDDDSVGLFKIENEPIFHEFNFVFLKNTDVEKYIELLN